MSALNVYYQGRVERILVGRLAVQNKTIFFEYAPSFLETKLEISPFKLSLKPGLQRCVDRVFEGIWGVFNDSLPDGWGRLLLDRKVMRLGLNPADLNPLERLAYVGTQGMGALAYEPEIESLQSSVQRDLDQIAKECQQLEQNGDEQFLDELYRLNGSSAGARPKILIRLENGEDWLIKFASSMDSEDMGSIEYAYHLMAEAAGLQVPRSRLFASQKISGYFGVQRFDRDEGRAVHMHTAAGLLHVDHRIPSLDYEQLIKASAWLTRDGREVEKLFRYAVFNVMAYNRDDHAKNFSFLMNAQGQWSVAPAYDLVFSSGPMGEHSTTVMGEGKYPGIQQLLRLAEVAQIDPNQAKQIIEQVQHAVARWPDFAESTGVKKASKRLIGLKLKN